jgi:hypothetical protein
LSTLWVGQFERVAGRYDPDIKDIIEVPVLPRLYELSERTDWILTKELQNTMEERKRQHAEAGGRERRHSICLESHEWKWCNH